MASGTIQTIAFSTKKASELIERRFLTSGWGHTENSLHGGDFVSDLRVVEMEFDEDVPIVNGHPTDPDRILVASHLNSFNRINNRDKSTGYGDSGGNDRKIKKYV